MSSTITQVESETSPVDFSKILAPTELEKFDAACGMALEMAEAPRLDWAKRYHRNTKGEPLDFEAFKFLVGPYSDTAQEIVSMKATQVGWSEWAINEVWHQCSLGRAVFYVLPTQTIRNTFVANRFDVQINTVPHYKALVDNATGESDATGMKHIGSGVVKFVGSNSFAEFGEFPADIVIIDEHDRCDPANLPYARDRLGASDLKLYRALGNPTVAGYGIAQLYEESDKRAWNIKCRHCGHWQSLDWFKNILREIDDNRYELIDPAWTPDSLAVGVFCVSCGKPMDRLAAGEWVATHPGRSVHGYQIGRLVSPTESIASLWAAWQKAATNETLKQQFYNSTLGLPYESSGAKLSRTLLDRSIENYTMPTSSDCPCTMGVDVGSELHVRISELHEGLRQAVYIGTVRQFSELDNLISQYSVQTGVIDRMPETRMARQLADRYPGRIWQCQYVQNEKLVSGSGNLSDFWMKLDHQSRVVQVDRTQSLDASHAAILTHKTILPSNAGSIDKYYDQMIMPTRLYDEGRNRFYWTKGEDHYRHSDNYDHIAARIRGMVGSMMV